MKRPSKNKATVSDVLFVLFWVRARESPQSEQGEIFRLSRKKEKQGNV
jgi:hypothetical protein